VVQQVWVRDDVRVVLEDLSFSHQFKDVPHICALCLSVESQSASSADGNKKLGSKVAREPSCALVKQVIRVITERAVLISPSLNDVRFGIEAKPEHSIRLTTNSETR